MVDVSYITDRTYGVLKKFMGAEYPYFKGVLCLFFEKRGYLYGEKHHNFMIYLSKKREVGGHKNGHQRSGKNVFVCEWNYNHAFF